MNKPTNNSSRPTFQGLIISWVIITIIHFAIYHVVAIARLGTHSFREFEAISGAIYSNDPAKREHHRNEQFPKMKYFAWLVPYVEKVQDGFSFAVSIPVIQFLEGPKSHNKSYYELTVPLSLRCLNSVLAAALILLIGFQLTRNASPQSRWRKFFGGSAGLEAGELPGHIDRLPMIRSIRFLKAAEQDERKRVVVYGVMHFIATYIVRLLEMSESISGAPGSWTTFAAIMRFPLSPFVIEDFNAALQNPSNGQTLGILLILNSAFVAVCLTIIIRLFKSARRVK